MLEVQDRIDGMVGLDSVKAKIDQLVNSAIAQGRRQDQGKKNPERDLNMLFVGPPGTGKTTVAREIAPLYQALGLVDSDKFVSVTGDELKSRYKGGSADKAKQVFAQAKGGVLFVDEAYALVSGENDEYGKEAIAALLPLLEDPNTVVIFGGYKSDLESMMGANAGLKSRFGETMEFESYTQDERAQILRDLFTNNDYKLDAGARNAIKDAVLLTGDGNARDVTKLMSQILYAQETRVVSEDADPDVITSGDVVDGAFSYQDKNTPDNRLMDRVKAKR